MDPTIWPVNLSLNCSWPLYCLAASSQGIESMIESESEGKKRVNRRLHHINPSTNSGAPFLPFAATSLLCSRLSHSVANRYDHLVEKHKIKPADLGFQNREKTSNTFYSLLFFCYSNWWRKKSMQTFQICAEYISSTVVMLCSELTSSVFCCVWFSGVPRCNRKRCTSV